MECKHAYKMRGVRYILCEKTGRPDAENPMEVAHAMCGHQRFCPDAHCCTLLPTWRECMRLRETPQNSAQEQRQPEATQNRAAKKRPPKAVKTAKGEAKNNIV